MNPGKEISEHFPIFQGKISDDLFSYLVEKCRSHPQKIAFRLDSPTFWATISVFLEKAWLKNIFPVEKYDDISRPVHAVAYRREERRGRVALGGTWAGEKRQKEKKILKKKTKKDKRKETIIAYSHSYAFMVLPFISTCFFVYFDTYLFRNDFRGRPP